MVRIFALSLMWPPRNVPILGTSHCPVIIAQQAYDVFTHPKSAYSAQACMLRSFRYSHEECAAATNGPQHAARSKQLNSSTGSWHSLSFRVARTWKGNWG